MYYDPFSLSTTMSKVIQARLDDETAAIRDELRSRLGWTDARIVREAIKMLASVTPGAQPKRKLRGIGKYDSGISDLGSNEKHLEGFGNDAMGKR